MTDDWLDLEPLAHDACILELPLAPLCGPDCLGLCPECGANRNHETCTCTEKTDPRWAGLAGLGAFEAIPEWRSDDGSPQEEDLEVEEPKPARVGLDAGGSSRSLCPQCNRAKLPHVVCPHCGWYKGRQAVEVN